MADNSVNLTRLKQKNNLHPYLSRHKHCQKNWITVSSSPADLYTRQKLLNCSRSPSHNTVTCKHLHCNLDDVTTKSKSKLVRFLSIVGQVSPAVENESLLSQGWLASRENISAMANLNEVSGIPKLIAEDSGRSTSALVSSAVLKFPGMSQCPVTQKVGH